jgi:hypothetical protein
MFVGRKRELAYLEERFNRERPELLILYGRRRIGKTELTKEFLREKRGIYYLAEKLPERLQLKKLSEKVIDFFREEIISEFTDWEMLFKYLASKRDRYVLVIDEFPYIIEREPELITVFQKGWDEYLSKSRVLLILTGSSISIMENSFLNYKSPLYGRRTGQVFLNQFSFSEINDFFEKKLEFDDLLKIWGTLGGVPFYLEQFDDNLDYYGNVKEKIFDQGEILFAEAEFILNEELREPRNYFAILRAISLGKRKLGEILNETGIDKSSIMKYISVLNLLGIVEKEVPAGEDAMKSKKGLYRIADNFFRFYFRYVFYYKDLILTDQKEMALKILRDTESQFFALTYEDLARSMANYFSQSRYFEIGRWWDRKTEIDLVGIDKEEKRILFGEVKWSGKAVGTDILRNLREKGNLSQWSNFEKIQYVIFSRSGFTEALMNEAKSDRSIILVHGTKRVV